jgi:type II secretory pathway pseudopilin PulG
MVISARRSIKLGGPGFTLLELLLVVVLIIGLLSALVFNFGTLKSGANLDEGGKQFEALMRFAAAHAANTGRAVQLRFDEASTNETLQAAAQLRVVREVDPVGQPGVFEDAPEAEPFLTELLERIRVMEVRGLQQPANQGTNELADAENVVTTMSPITFFPDGTSDSAVIVVQSSDPDDLRQMTIHLAGVTGAIRTEIKTLDEMIPIEWMDEEDQKTSVAENSASRALPEIPEQFETTSTNVFDEDFP